MIFTTGSWWISSAFYGLTNRNSEIIYEECNDIIIGFGITIFIWSFALAAIYKSTKSVIACALYHAFIDAIGVVYDWNALFDGFPGSVSTNVYRSIWLTVSVVLWLIAEKKEKLAAL